MTEIATITVTAPTTAFTAASFCSTPLLYSSFILRGVTCGGDGQPKLAPSCFPGGVDFVLGLGTSLENASVEVYFTSIFSCPAGYKNAFSTARDGETRVACCPSDYVFTTSKHSIYSTIDRFWCQSTFTGGQMVTQRYCQGANTGGTEIASTVAVLTQTGNSDGSRFESVFITASPGDWGLEMYPDTNFAIPLQMVLEPASTPRSTSVTTTQSFSSSTAISPGTGSGSHSSTNNGLSTIAQIIIGVLVPSFVIIIGIAIFVTYRVRKRRKHLGSWWTYSSPPSNPPIDQTGYQKPELAGNAGNATISNTTVGNGPVGTQTQQSRPVTNPSAELSDHGSRFELEVIQKPQELSTDR